MFFLDVPKPGVSRGFGINLGLGINFGNENIVLTQKTQKFSRKGLEINTFILRINSFIFMKVLLEDVVLRDFFVQETATGKPETRC